MHSIAALHGQHAQRHGGSHDDDAVDQSKTDRLNARRLCLFTDRVAKRSRTADGLQGGCPPEATWPRISCTTRSYWPTGTPLAIGWPS